MLGMLLYVLEIHACSNPSPIFPYIKHEVFRNDQHWTQARAQLLPWQDDILKFLFSYILYKTAK
jgi:hypothetical protein